jgi:hypothetical protein
MSFSIVSLLTEEQRQQLGVLGLLPAPLRLPAAAAAGGALGAASPGFEELPEWAQARTPRPEGEGEDDEDEEPIAAARHVLAAAPQDAAPEYDVCDSCGAMHLPADNHHHGQGEDDEDDDVGEGEG